MSHLYPFFCLPTSLQDRLSSIHDFRKKNKNFRHSLTDILILSICAVFCGAENFEDIETFGRQRKELLQEFVPLANGILSHDTVRRVFIHLDATLFNEVFLSWVEESIKALPDYEHISIDGKTLRGSKSGIHIVSAVATETGLSLAQVKTQEKSNEITAIPELLRLLALKDKIVSIDAIGTQKAIVEQIVKQQGNYLIALKGNQKGLLEQFERQWQLKGASDCYECQDWSASDNKIVNYKVELSNNLDWIEDKDDWPELSCSARVETQSEKRKKEVRYYISSLKDLSALRAYKLTRGHWAIENKLHWQLDVTFREDAQRHRTGESAENFSLLRKIVLNTINLHKEKSSKRKVLKQMAWGDDYFRTMIKKIFNL